MSALAAWLDIAVVAVVWSGLIVLALSMVACGFFLIASRVVADRAIAFDLAMVHVVGLIALSAILLNQSILLDALIVISVLGFLGTVAIARYLERSLKPGEKGAAPASSAEGGAARDAV